MGEGCEGYAQLSKRKDFIALIPAHYDKYCPFLLCYDILKIGQDFLNGLYAGAYLEIRFGVGLFKSGRR